MRTGTKTVFVGLLAACIFSGRVIAQERATQEHSEFSGLDAFVDKALADWKVPGAGVAVIQNDKIILLRGFGMRDREKQLPVTPKTLFAIGSATKSFTVASLGVLVAQGKLSWDKPVRDYMPDLRLYDETVTERITPRDLVTHRSGLPRHDALWYNSEATRPELLSRLRYLEPSKDFRSTWQYNNLMFFTAGFLAERVSGMPWEDLVRRTLFAPLEMKGSDFSVAEMAKSADYAQPYEKNDKQEITHSSLRDLTAMGPAGSINSSAEEMAHYIQMHLAKGKYAGKQVLAEADVMEMQTPQMVTPVPVRFSEVGHTSYGMGLFVTTYRGHKLVHHGGNIDGYSALVSFMPQDNLGVVVLTNMNASALPTVLTYNLYDRLLNMEQVKWSERLLSLQMLAKLSESEAKAKNYTPQKPNTHPSHEIADFAGTYSNPGYGTVLIKPAGKDLEIVYNRFTSPLKHYHYDVFQVPENALDRLEKTKVMFQTDWNGNIARLSIPLEPDVQDIVFTRQADAAMRELTFLKPLAGDYALGGTVMTVTLRGDRSLTLLVPGQPQYELEAVRGATFNLKGLSGYSVEFKNGGQELVFMQPDGNHVAKRK